MKKMVLVLILALTCSTKADTALSLCGDVFPPGTPGAMDCGDGIVNILDLDEAGRIIENLVTPTACQLINGDVPNGTPAFCGNPAGVANCERNGVFDVLDYLVIIDKASNRDNCCDHCFMDTDRDGLINGGDNCAGTPNGLFLGTCTQTIKGVVTSGSGRVCAGAGICPQDESCSMNQEDYNSNGVGDACECYGDFDQDGDSDGTDAAIFKKTFGRNRFFRPCPATR